MRGPVGPRDSRTSAASAVCQLELPRTHATISASVSLAPTHATRCHSARCKDSRYCSRPKMSHTLLRCVHHHQHQAFSQLLTVARARFSDFVKHARRYAFSY